MNLPVLLTLATLTFDLHGVQATKAPQLFSQVLEIEYEGPNTEAKQVEKIDIDKLSGKWERKEKNGVIVLEITKDGKAQFVLTRDGKDYTFEGTCKVTGNKIEMTMKLGEKEEKSTRTITKLTNTELVTEDDAGMKREFARVKVK